ncbi:MAG: hypothetical protein RSB37_03080 [Acetivibrio sp.]
MTLDEKLRVFYDSTIADANKQSENILFEYQESLKNIYEEHKKEAEEKAAFTLELEAKKLVQDKNKMLSLDNLDFKRQIKEKTEALKDILFEEVMNKLTSFMKTEDYFILLEKQIREAASFARGDHITIYINQSDLNKKESLEEKTGVSLTASTFDFWGGTRAVIHEKNILIDRSFSTKFSEEKDSFSL